MIRVVCWMCETELTEPGAILISPPTLHGICAKYHICVDCFTRLMETE